MNNYCIIIRYLFIIYLLIVNLLFSRFVCQLLRLLVCNGEKFGGAIQRHVKEIIGQDMSTQLYPLLFDEMRCVIEQFFDKRAMVC